MVKCAEHILLHPLLQWLLNLEEVVRTATAGISVCQEAPDWHSKMLHLQYATGRAEWSSSGSLATPGQVIREGKDVSDVTHSVRDSSIPAGILFNAILYPYGRHSPTLSALKGHERQSSPPQVPWQGISSWQWPWVVGWPSPKGEICIVTRTTTVHTHSLVPS